jgi:carbamate kinase
MLAAQIGAEMFIMLTDVAGVYLDFGTDRARMIASANPQALQTHNAAFKAGSMGPKVQAACDFVTASGHMAGIGQLADAIAIIEKNAGTIITVEQSGISYRA